jgi:hypothetical protein
MAIGWLVGCMVLQLRRHFFFLGLLLSAVCMWSCKNGSVPAFFHGSLFPFLRRRTVGRSCTSYSAILLLATWKWDEMIRLSFHAPSQLKARTETESSELGKTRTAELFRAKLFSTTFLLLLARNQNSEMWQLTQAGVIDNWHRSVTWPGPRLAGGGVQCPALAATGRR